MSIASLVVVLLVVGFVIWLIQTVPIPINPWFKNAIVGILLIALVIWLLQIFGFPTFHFTRI